MPARRRKTIYLKALSNVKENAYRRVLDAIGLKRRNPSLSVSRAAKASGTTIKTMRKYAASVFENRGRALDVTPSDQLVRRMRMLTPKGEVKVVVTDSRTATEISDHYNALKKRHQNPELLKPFEDKVVVSDGRVYKFATDPETINRLFRAGAVHVLGVYATDASSCD